MFGLVIALLYAAFMPLFQSLPMEAVYLSATAFLYHWYLLWAIVLGAFVCTFALVPLVGGTAAGAMKGGVIGAALGFLLGGGASLLIVGVFMFRRLLYLGGSYLLSTALVDNVWNVPRVVIGALLLLVALFARTRHSS